MPSLRAGVLCALIVFLAVRDASAVPIHGNTVTSFQPGPQNIADFDSPPADFGTPSNALGPKDGTLVSLGERGQITIQFQSPLMDGPGTDLFVFENPFAFTDDVGESFVFAELGFVEVSTDGEIFARFPTFSPIDGPIGDFGVIPQALVDQFQGLAGLRVEGDPFDFGDLAPVPVVQSGLVDLGDIRFIRIRDVIGDGSEFDGLGDPIFDPWPSDFASSGFDLDAVQATHPVPEPSTLVLTALALAGVTAWHRRRARSSPPSGKPGFAGR
jgi:hypothetical protein